MSMINDQLPTQLRRPRLWWWLVVAGSLLYVLAMVSYYLLLWLPINSRLAPLILDIVLLALAAFAASRDIAAARARRPLQPAEGLAVAATGLLMLLWLAGWLLLPVLPREGVIVLKLLIVIPIVPVVALAVLGTTLFRRSGRS
ncbi:hypothetical protein [Rhizomonospora bruguierae]|uniref:hypothetical protein n=1 Tax=Rhizomonospora bruguierae TaxID=1581705 RepID=UPI001BD176C5|nr:hypothetical protein [Micromonospora sp. NBRC 107566]